MAFAGTTAGRPEETYLKSSPDSAPIRLTEVNAFADRLRLGKQETITWDTTDTKGKRDGMHDNGVLTYPPDYVAGRTCPVLVMIHGGPGYASFRTFNLEAQRFAANGWIVFEPNYRGSDNLGAAFMSAISNDAIAGPSRDIMGGLALLRSRGLVQKGKIAVYGTSYGGTLAAALLGLYTSEWVAGVVESGILDFFDEYYLSDSPWWPEFGFPPDTAEHRAAYSEQSPMAYAGKVTAPTLILSDLGDMRAPEMESLRFWEQLKLDGTTTSLIVYELAGHEPSDPKDIHDAQDRSILWLRPYLQ